MYRYGLVSVFLKSGAISIWLSAVTPVPGTDSTLHSIIRYGMNICGRNAEMVGSIHLGLNKFSITLDAKCKENNSNGKIRFEAANRLKIKIFFFLINQGGLHIFAE